MENDDIEELIESFASRQTQPRLLLEPELEECLQRIRGLRESSAELASLSQRDSSPEEKAGFSINQRVGAYLIVEAIGRGGMGDVYKVLHQPLGQFFAMKRMSGHHLANANARQRFSREMRFLARIKHPHVVAATDGGQFDGMPYVVMDLIDGTDAASLVRERGCLPVPVACELIRQACLGIAELHRHELIHRDIKPANLLIGWDGIVRIADFGLARSSTPDAGPQLTASHHAVGTILYMAPEQLEGGRCSQAADIYSLGATLYFLLFGKPPSRFRIEVSEEANLKELLQRLLMLHPDQRIQSAEEVVEQISEFCDSERWAAYLSEFQQVCASAADSAPTEDQLSAFRLAETAVEQTTHDDSNLDFHDAGELSRSAASDERGDVPSTNPPAGWPLTRAWWVALGVVAFALVATLGILSLPTRQGEIQETEHLQEKPAIEQSNHASNEAETLPAHFTAEDGLRERKGAQWAVERGAKLLLLPTKNVLQPADLPTQKFLVLNMNLEHCKVTADETQILKTLHNLASLRLNGNPISGASLAHLSHMEDLRWLYLKQCDLDDSAIESLNPLCSHLETLDLSGNQVSAVGIGKLASSPVLRELYLAGCPISSRALVQMERFPSLIRLNISKTPVDSEATEALHACPNLRHLVIHSTAIGDEAINDLTQIKSLRLVEAQHTLFTDAGKQRLLEEMPDCEFVWKWQE